MKRITLHIACMLCIFFSSCGSLDIIAESKAVREVDTADMLILEYDDVRWDDEIGDFTDRLNISAETAMKIVDLVLAEMDIGSLENTTSSIAFIEEEKIYVVTYQPTEIMLGNVTYVAIKATTGEILKMWGGE